MIIRRAKSSDAEELLNIYAPYVEKTAITFEYTVPSVSEFKHRIHQTLTSFPYLVFQEDEAILGYAYASSYKDRAAYDWACEVSIYVAEKARGKQIGTRLYDALENELEKMGIKTVLACITYPNEVSIGFHQDRGYEKVGHFTKMGYKFERWHDIVWMQKRLED
ncbi:GNAT family N-acetyltransferase [Streptococcus halotolerans]|uniref:GNAT family N-acetyltransferase n=1 Tax=Streptococcus halotolerans TaxID=1814128 RepID=UPI0007892AE6|nr:GNAT family N-acetyltransferase [Streptococcus halotolerans]